MQKKDRYLPRIHELIGCIAALWIKHLIGLASWPSSPRPGSPRLAPFPCMIINAKTCHLFIHESYESFRLWEDSDISIAMEAFAMKNPDCGSQLRLRGPYLEKMFNTRTLWYSFYVPSLWPGLHELPDSFWQDVMNILYTPKVAKLKMVMVICIEK